jgi:ribosomal protein S18 acetylase RimI-like enzyme
MLHTQIAELIYLPEAPAIPGLIFRGFRGSTDYPKMAAIAKGVKEADQVAGMVRSFINHDENVEYERQRGWTEDICVRRPWRRRGLARALLVKSLHAIKERGMNETALGVDTDNPNGALRLYESVGFQMTKRFFVYRKSF